MGHANVHECGAWMQDHVHILYIYIKQNKTVALYLRVSRTQGGRKIGMMLLSR